MNDYQKNESLKKLEIQTTNNVIIDISSEYITESEFFRLLIDLKCENPIKLNIDSDNLKLIYSYMKYSKLNPPNIKLIEKPAIKSINEYLSDNWYIDFFPESLYNCQILFNSADYLGMNNLCKIIIGHIGYKLNNIEDRNIKNEIMLPNNNNNIKKIFNIKTNKFENMTDNEITKYIKNQKKNWKIVSQN